MELQDGGELSGVVGPRCAGCCALRPPPGSGLIYLFIKRACYVFSPTSVFSNRNVQSAQSCMKPALALNVFALLASSGRRFSCESLASGQPCGFAVFLISNYP